MQCDMPGCKNESSKKLACPEIINGVVIGPHDFHYCSKHQAIELYNHIRQVLADKAASVQIVNPFQDIKLQKNALPPSR